MNIVRRSRYLDRLIAFQDTDLIKIVTGIRRCGKSTLLDMMREHLAQQGVPAERLLTFKMESLEYAGITDYLTFYRMVRERVDGVDRPYLFFDELQNVEGWEKAVNSLRIDLPCDIYVTGSNAFLLSSELATLISGRYIEVKMQPLTFGEYLDFRSIDAVVAEGLGERAELVSKTGDRLNSNTVLEQYITYGGMPFLAHDEPRREPCRDYIRSLYQTIVARDILLRATRRGRGAITKRDVLERLCAYLADNISNQTSVNKIVGTLNESSGGKTNASTVSAYIDALEETYLFTKVKRYDVKGRELLETGGKYYIADTGIRSYLDGYRGSDSGRMLENVIYNQLVFEGYEVFCGHLRAGEIDFVAIGEGSDRKYIQVTERIDAEATRERELRPLKLNTLGKIPDSYEKILIVRDGEHPTDIDGIRIVGAVDFLLRNKIAHG